MRKVVITHKTFADIVQHCNRLTNDEAKTKQRTEENARKTKVRTGFFTRK